jgi:hypothetical protein
MAEVLEDDPFEEGDDEFNEPTEYDEDAEMAKGEAITKARAESGSLEPAPEGTEGLGNPDLDARAEAAREGEGPADAVGADEVGMFSHMRATKKGADTTVPTPELEALMARVRALEGKNEPEPFSAIPAPDADKPFRYYLTQLHGGKWAVHAFRNLDTLQGFAQALPGEKRAFAYTKMPESNETRATLQEITASGSPVKR